MQKKINAWGILVWKYEMKTHILLPLMHSQGMRIFFRFLNINFHSLHIQNCDEKFRLHVQHIKQIKNRRENVKKKLFRCYFIFRVSSFSRSYQHSKCQSHAFLFLDSTTLTTFIYIVVLVVLWLPFHISHDFIIFTFSCPHRIWSARRNIKRRN